MLNTQISLFALLLAVGSIQATFLLLSLLTTGKKRKHANIALALLIGLFIVELIDQFLIETGFKQRMPFLAPFAHTTDVLYGPVIYLYVLRVTQLIRPRASKYFAIHFLPAAISLVLGGYIILSVPSSKLADYLQSGQTTSSILGITEFITTIFGVFSIFAYLATSVLVLFRHQRTISENFSFTESIDLQWLRTILLTLSVLYLIYFSWFLLVINNASYPIFVEQLLYICIVCSIFFMGFKGLRQPQVFDLVSGLSPTTESAPIDSRGEKAADKSAYRGSGIDARESLMIFEELQAYLDKTQLFLEPKLTLAQLANQSGFKSHYLSQAINQNRQANFFDFINQYRIEFAKGRLLANSEKPISVLAIAMESGFNSKSSFYSAFRKHTGKTPNQYRQAMLSQGQNT